MTTGRENTETEIDSETEREGVKWRCGQMMGTKRERELRRLLKRGWRSWCIRGVECKEEDERAAG